MMIAAAAFSYGTFADSPPLTNADRAHALAKDFACPVCAGQSVAESDVPVAREIRRQIATWVDEGRNDTYIRDELVAAYNTSIDYAPSVSGITGLVWILPVLFVGAAVLVLTAMFNGGSIFSMFSNRHADSSCQATNNYSKFGTASKKLNVKTDSDNLNVSDTPNTSETLSDSKAHLRRKHQWRNAFVWVTVVALLAGASGVFVTRFSQSRRAGDSITGEIANSTRELIFQAQQAIRDGDINDAIATSSQVLELQPSNVEALTYKGWLMSRLANTADEPNAAVSDVVSPNANTSNPATAETTSMGEAIGYLDEAIALQPQYPDARLFRAIVALNEGDASRAATELATFDELDTPPYAESLLAASLPCVTEWLKLKTLKTSLRPKLRYRK